MRCDRRAVNKPTEKNEETNGGRGDVAFYPPTLVTTKILHHHHHHHVLYSKRYSVFKVQRISSNQLNRRLGEASVLKQIKNKRVSGLGLGVGGGGGGGAVRVLFVATCKRKMKKKQTRKKKKQAHPINM